VTSTAGLFSAAYDRLFTDKRRRKIEHIVVALSVVGFLAHLAAIFVARNFPGAPPAVEAFGHNYFSAVATPFNFVLFYEVLILIAAIPQSTTKSLETQYEIVSLIFMRGFFQDIAEIDLDKLKEPTSELGPAFQDVSAGILMFLLVAIFRHATRKKDAGPPLISELVEKFIARKKLVSLCLTILFLVLAGRSIWEVAVDLAQGQSELHIQTGFYAEVFTAMIFTDVLILLFSLLVSDHYELVFRNGAFVVSTILIRAALTAGHPFGAVVGVAGMVFGIVTVLIYNYYLRVSSRKV
jgi:hypothetical protein